MSDNKIGNNSNIVENSCGLGFALWVIMFWGDPDIADAIIHYLMQ